MTKPCLLAVLSVFGCWFTGCNQDNSSSEPSSSQVKTTATRGAKATESTMAIAVVDLDAIGQRVGRIDETKAAMKQKETELNDKLQLLVSSYETDLKLERDKLGEEASDDKKKEFLLLQKRLSTNVQKAQLSARQELALHKSTMLTRFREEVKPIALQVAKEHGMSVVLTANLVFAAEGTVDITDEVVEQYLKQFASSARPNKRDALTDNDVDAPRVSQEPSGGAFRN